MTFLLPILLFVASVFRAQNPVSETEIKQEKFIGLKGRPKQVLITGKMFFVVYNTRTKFDPEGRSRETKAPHALEPYYTRKLSFFDERGNPIREEIFGKILLSQKFNLDEQPLMVVERKYDDRNRIIEESHLDPNGEREISFFFRYNEQGNVVQRIRFAYNKYWETEYRYEYDKYGNYTERKTITGSINGKNGRIYDKTSIRILRRTLR